MKNHNKVAKIMAKQLTVTEENFLHKGEDSGWENCYFAVLKFGYAKPPAGFFFLNSTVNAANSQK